MGEERFLFRFLYESPVDLVSNPFLGETKVTAWFLVRRVDYGIIDDYLFHGAILSVIRLGRKRCTPNMLTKPGKSSEIPVPYPLP
jgi:hypothetical protein